jgi:hypothetical protein
MKIQKRISKVFGTPKVRILFAAATIIIAVSAFIYFCLQQRGSASDRDIQKVGITAQPTQDTSIFEEEHNAGAGYTKAE